MAANDELKSSPLTLSKTFASNIIHRIDRHNRLNETKVKSRQRAFVNEERKKQTKKSLDLNSSGTMYSDFMTQEKTPIISFKGKKKVITPFQHVKRIVSDAAAFDKANPIEENPSSSRKRKVILNKTLLVNHLKHTNVHNRLKEEQEMWDLHFQQKKRKNQLVASKKIDKCLLGTMYSDREPNKTKPQRISRCTVQVSEDDSDDVEIIAETRYFGKYTKKLLELKENDKEKWGHSGFKEFYGREIDNGKNIKRKVVRSTRVKKLNEKRETLSKKVLTRNNKVEDCRKVLDETQFERKISQKKGLASLSHSDEMNAKSNYIRTKKRVARRIQKWSHEQEDVEISPLKKRVRSCAIKKKDLVEVQSSEGEWEERDIVITSGKGTASKDAVIVDRSCLRNSIHEEGKKVSIKKSRLVVPINEKNKGNGDLDKDIEFSKSTRKIVTNKRYTSDKDSSFTESSSDERFKTIKNTQKLKKHKSTFSDYDSDLEQRF